MSIEYFGKSNLHTQKIYSLIIFLISIKCSSFVIFDVLKRCWCQQLKWCFFFGIGSIIHRRINGIWRNCESLFSARKNSCHPDSREFDFSRLFGILKIYSDQQVFLEILRFSKKENINCYTNSLRQKPWDLSDSELVV